jgi:O-antigen ligase
MIGVSILIGFQFLPLDIQNRIRTLWDPEAGPKIAQKSAEGRWEGFQAGLKMFKDYPVTGVGVDNFIPYRIAHVDGVALGAHNLIGEILGETGLLGIAAFALFVSIALLNCHRVQRLGARAHGQIIPDIMRQMVLSCRDVIVLLFFHGMAAHNLDRYNWLWVAAFCSLAYNFAQTSTELDNASDLEMAPWTTLG